MAKRRAKSIHIGIGLILASTLAFTIMSALIRSLGDRIPLGEIAFSRSLFALIPLLLMLQWQGELRDAFILKKPIRHLTRAIAGIGSMFCNFASLARLPLADMTAIGFITRDLYETAFSALAIPGQGAHGAAQKDKRPVRALVPTLVGGAAFGCSLCGFVVGLAACAIFRSEDFVRGPTDHLAGGPAQNSLRTRRPGRDSALGIGGYNDIVRGSFDYQPQAFLALTRTK